jgi:hypothetical protein
MSRFLYWFNNSGVAQPVYQSSNSITYDYWYTDDAHTIPALTTDGRPGTISGDALFFDQGTLTPNSSATWSGATLVAGTLELEAVSGEILNVDDTCVVSSGVAIIPVTGTEQIYIGATWEDDILLTNFALATLTTGWMVRNGSSGSIDLEGTGTTGALTIQAPGAQQARTFVNITLSSASLGTIDLSNMGSFALLGTLFLGERSIFIPMNGTVTLASATAVFQDTSMQVVAGHVPALGAILTADNLFGDAGTYVPVAASDVKQGVQVGVQPQVGTLAPGGAIAGRIIGG